MEKSRGVLTFWVPVIGLAASATWFVWGFVPPSVVKAPPAWVELELIPALLGLLFVATVVGLIVSRGRSGVAWVAVILLGAQLLMAAMLLAVMYMLRDF